MLWRTQKKEKCLEHDWHIDIFTSHAAVSMTVKEINHQKPL